jgi:quercetin dioxygenase-like cupin family protein
MVYTKTEYDSVEPKAPGMHFLRDALDCEQLGVTVLDAGEGWEGMEHDHADEDHEEVYVLVEGSGEITVEGETVSLAAGDAVRVAPGATRSLSFDAESQMVIAGAP